MTAAGRAKHEKGVPGYAKWAPFLLLVDRSSYCVKPWNGFAPRCRLSEILALGKNGAGVKARN
eukprot:3612566-Pleurochrysis_carterae.AAC.1